ncbi:hypothetical protein [Kineosporia sp. NBRC 101731]|uniref:hypothetical protein n=1 Tax=Kineosporia sp. NBRC 101731 TaxID=3032199 RepID=UPI0024A254B2|nr:hypothetical protein [Kineosporia sp. NBRC 101731]GLY30923.1 hypothetical protein Kisp02_42880 [Kineosporia sp. NBRC 101731]
MSFGTDLEDSVDPERCVEAWLGHADDLDLVPAALELDRIRDQLVQGLVPLAVDPQPALDAALLLVRRGDQAGAALLLRGAAPELPVIPAPDPPGLYL